MRVFTIAKRVSKEFFRDKRTLAMMFVAPIFIMWLMSVVFSASTTTDVSVASVNTPTNVVEIMKNVDNVSLEQYQTKEEADTFFFLLEKRFYFHSKFFPFFIFLI